MNIVIGLGTGRCGTVSLANLLNSQPDARVTHEVPPLLPWDVNLAQMDARLTAYRSSNHQFAGDVAFYYLPYVRHIAAYDRSVRFVCLKRDREETVASYLKKTGNWNHWYNHEGNGWELNAWDSCFPKFPIENKADAIRAYWDTYYEEAERLCKEVEHFRIWDMEALNTPQGVAEILEFVGIDRKQVLVGIRRNQGNVWLKGLMDGFYHLSPRLARLVTGCRQV